MSRRVIEQLRSVPEHDRYLRGMRSWVGFRQIGIPVERAERFAGQSKYGLLRYLKLASDAIFSFSVIPIRASAILGLSAVSLSALFSLYAVAAKLILHQVQRDLRPFSWSPLSCPVCSSYFWGSSENTSDASTKKLKRALCISLAKSLGKLQHATSKGNLLWTLNTAPITAGFTKPIGGGACANAGCFRRSGELTFVRAG